MATMRRRKRVVVSSDEEEEPQPSIKLSKVHVDTVPQLSTNASKVNVDVDPQPSVKASKLNIDAEPQPSTKASKVNVDVDPRPSIKVANQNIDSEPQPPIKVANQNIDLEPQPSIKVANQNIDSEPQPPIKVANQNIDGEPQQSLEASKVNIDGAPQPSIKVAKQKVDAELQPSITVLELDLDVKPQQSLEASKVNIDAEPQPSIKVANQNIDAELQPSRKVSKLNIHAVPSVTTSSSPAASSASSTSNPSPRPSSDATLTAMMRRRKRVVVSSDEEEELQPSIKASKVNVVRESQPLMKAAKLNLQAFPSMTTSSSTAASSASSTSNPSLKPSPDATLDGADDDAVVISSGESTPTPQGSRGLRRAASATSSNNPALPARPTQRAVPESLPTEMRPTARRSEPLAPHKKAPPVPTTRPLDNTTVPIRAKASTALETTVPIRAQASTAQCDPYIELTGKAAIASKRCMDALVHNFGPTVRHTVRGGHTRLIHGIDCHDGPSALKSYQLAGVQWLETLYAANFGCILADEMGLGKTLQVLTFLERQVKDGNTALVVAPVSLLTNWEEEVAKWTNLRVFRYHSANASAREQLANEYFSLETRPHIILTSPNVLLNPTDRRTFIKQAGPFSVLVCDEGHFLKNSKSSKVVNLHKIEAPMRILMTGTPIQNDLSELVNLLWFVLPDSFRALRDHFQNRGTMPLELIQKLGAPFILRRLKADVLNDLPAKNVVPIWCHMGETQRKHHDELKLSHCDGAPNDFKSLFSRLRRICNAPIMNQQKFSKQSYVELAGRLRLVRADYAAASDANVMREITQWSDYEVHQIAMEYGFKEPFRATANEIMAGCKIEALLDLLSKRRDKKTLLFSQFTQFLDVLEAALCLSKYAYLRLDGSTPAEERQKLVKKFNAPEGPNVFMLSTKAGGTGLNLVAADACILMDLDFNPQNNRQAEDRIHRLGQTRNVTVYYLLCKDTLEEKILAINERKINLDEKFGGQKQDVDPKKVIQWIMSNDE